MQIESLNKLEKKVAGWLKINPAATKDHILQRALTEFEILAPSIIKLKIDKIFFTRSQNENKSK